MPRTWLPRSRALILGAVLVLAALGARAVLSSPGEPEPEPEPEVVAPEPEPEPEPPPPVEGSVELADVVDLSTAGTQLYGSSMPEDEPVPFDDDAIEVFAAAVGGWLDDHLSDLQNGGPGLTVDLDLDGVDDVVGLVDPDHLATRVSYVIVVGARGGPEWAEVDVVVEREDGSSTAARLAFAAEDGATLVAGHGADPAGGDSS